MREEVERFFAAYRDAFNATDASAVARHIAAPCILVERETTLWRTDDDVQQAVASLLAFYTRNGFEKAQFTVERVMALDGNNVVADITWKIDRSEGRPVWQFRTGYNLRRSDGIWRIVSCTAYEEAEVRQRIG